MSKKKVTRKPAPQAVEPPDAGRRNFVLLGAGALAVAGVGAAAAYNAGWFGSEPVRSFNSSAPRPAGRNLAPLTLPADQPNALRAANEMIEHYARDLANASSLIHAVRAFGKGFKLADGTGAVEHLCARYAVDKEVNGRRYVYFSRDAEVHENSFLKTLLEAGVAMDQPVVAGANRYKLRDVAESAKALFRCDPADLFKFDDRKFRYDPVAAMAMGKGELVHEHLPWGLIAFTILLPPPQASWMNAYGETINLPVVIDRALAEYESTCALGRAALAQGVPAPADFRTAIKNYSCFGLHSVYGFLACWRRGYTNNELPERLKQTLDLVTWRLKGDAEASDREYDEAEQKALAQGQSSPPLALEAFKLRARIKLLGHAFESLNYAKLHKLVAFTPAQEQRIAAGERALYESLVKLRATDWSALRKVLGDKFISDVVIALGHAARGLKLLTPDNPDALA